MGNMFSSVGSIKEIPSGRKRDRIIEELDKRKKMQQDWSGPAFYICISHAFVKHHLIRLHTTTTLGTTLPMLLALSSFLREATILGRSPSLTICLIHIILCLI